MHAKYARSCGTWVAVFLAGTLGACTPTYNNLNSHLYMKYEESPVLGDGKTSNYESPHVVIKKIVRWKPRVLSPQEEAAQERLYAQVKLDHPVHVSAGEVEQVLLDSNSRSGKSIITATDAKELAPYIADALAKCDETSLVYFSAERKPTRVESVRRGFQLFEAILTFGKMNEAPGPAPLASTVAEIGKRGGVVTLVVTRDAEGNMMRPPLSLQFHGASWN